MMSFSAVSALPVSKRRVAQDFARAAASYDGAARLQRQVGEALLQALPASFRPAHLLDLGCGTGLQLPALTRRFPDAEALGVDLAEGMLGYARQHHAEAVIWLAADAEALPFADQSIDLIFSSLMVQWCPRLDKVLQECFRVLRPGGRLALSTLLAGTLCELSSAWAAVDPNRSHSLQFLSLLEVDAACAAVFPQYQLRTQSIQLRYPDPLALMRELKALGAQNKQPARKSATAPGRLRAFEQAYCQQSGLRQGVVATYQVAYLLAEKTAVTIQPGSRDYAVEQAHGAP